MTSAPLRIVIAGGGTAGWMTANLLAKQGLNRPLQITLVESPDIGIIGVGEGSTPTLKRFFAEMDIAEEDWMPACNATYKVSIRFDGWSPAAQVNSYAHPFISQLDTFSERFFYVNCFHRRMGHAVNTTPGDFLFNAWLAKHNLSPKTPPNFPFRIEYGYHFDSGLVGEYVKRHAATLGVVHKALNITGVDCHPNGDIAGLKTAEGDVIEGDFFIDCTGFKSLLLQQTLKVPFHSFKSNLFNDSAVVCPTPALTELPVETRSTALSAGWAWQIPLTNRTGNGYVYSSDFISDDQAASELCHHLGLNENEADLRKLTMQVGQVAEHWAKNCLAVGLSQGFIEPLEATALHLVQTGVEIFIDHIRAGGFTETQRTAYNRIISERFERVRDYIVAHYRLNTRSDSEYWLANQHNEQLSDALFHLLNVWYRRGDLGQEIARQQLDSHFGNTSWHCLLAGYGAFPPLEQSSNVTEDLYQQNKLDAFFRGCLLNFSPPAPVIAK
ncbi:tryptophan halogenase family protein [Alteromonas lipolytica]|uniref:Tryptophan halogenase n=1 Tax=Alteromonas lipolytica TaxID=1856405 RepID=A0A1E8FDP0_9ALTE|nr:tryptophan halogenase family protein [Alteromonas lipolytica]OFI34029.1 tryptophan halogenase [Alteromonas lipolytica]GGF66080.1 tryptophan halogenase [Alteromonas lipolytica]